MAASHTLPHSHAIRKSGVLVLNGYGISVQVHAGHLVLHDGIADERRTIRLPRVNHGLKRLVMIGSDGFITLQALRWLADQDAAFIMLGRDGTVLLTTGPVSPPTLGFGVRRLWHITRESPSKLHANSLTRSWRDKSRSRVTTCLL